MGKYIYKKKKKGGVIKSSFFLKAVRNILLAYLADFSCVGSQYRSKKCLLYYPHVFKTPGKQLEVLECFSLYFSTRWFAVAYLELIHFVE